MEFTNDYSQAYEVGGLKPAGDYEVIIVKAEEKQTKGGKTYLSMSMVIRNDVDQGYKNAYLFHSLWKRREPSKADEQVNGYSFGQLMSLGKAAGLPNGKKYASLTEFLQDLMNKPVKAHLVHDEYNGNKREAIAFFAPTSYAEVRHVMKKKIDVDPEGYASASKQTAYANQTSADGFQAMPLDDDLPF